jgi:hypothetical protein
MAHQEADLVLLLTDEYYRYSSDEKILLSQRCQPRLAFLAIEQSQCYAVIFYCSVALLWLSDIAMRLRLLFAVMLFVVEVVFELPAPSLSS